MTDDKFIKGEALDIEKVINGFVVKPPYRAEYGPQGRPAVVMVFPTQRKLNGFLTKHFTEEVATDEG